MITNIGTHWIAHLEDYESIRTHCMRMLEM